jgi:hypothetical protein
MYLVGTERERALPQASFLSPPPKAKQTRRYIRYPEYKCQASNKKLRCSKINMYEYEGRLRLCQNVYRGINFS